jgi:transcriptional regulator with GAF, ATPase, and Fis domain
MGEVILKFVERDAEGYLGYRIDGTRTGEPSTTPKSRIVGGYQIQRFAGMLASVATSELSVLLYGESGTGKEVFAQELHERSNRRGLFQAVNCGAIPATLIEAELFGHKRGAFSGADRDRPGLIRAADGGTLFLDEIGDMPLDAQVKLLRVIQSKEVLPVGAAKAERVDVRIVCATHRDLRKLQRSETFRGDLFARLNEFSLSLPSLRERKEDLLALCRTLAQRHGRSEVRETLLFMTGLLHYDFPFNVRELEALIKRWIALSSEPTLDAEHLTDEIKEQMKAYGSARAEPRPKPARPEPLDSASPASPVKQEPARSPGPAPRSGQSEAPSEQELRELLAHHQGNVAAVGRQLGKDRVQVHRWMRRYGINIGEYR